MYGRSVFDRNEMAREHELANMSWQARIADEYKRGGNPDIARCPCNGSGWIVSPVETVSQCPFHFRGQPHPEEDYICEMLSFSTVEHTLHGDAPPDHAEAETIVFQVMDGKTVNIYCQETGAAIHTKMRIKGARQLWADLRKQGYLTKAEYDKCCEEYKNMEDRYLDWYPGY